MMRVISRKKLREFSTKHADAKDALDAWFKTVRKAIWLSWDDVKRTYPKGDHVECCLVFNICGGNYRLIVRHAQRWRRLFIVGVYGHRKYDRGDWKRYCTCR